MEKVDSVLLEFNEAKGLLRTKALARLAVAKEDLLAVRSLISESLNEKCRKLNTNPLLIFLFFFGIAFALCGTVPSAPPLRALLLASGFLLAIPWPLAFFLNKILLKRVIWRFVRSVPRKTGDRIRVKPLVKPSARAAALRFGKAITHLLFQINLRKRKGKGPSPQIPVQRDRENAAPALTPSFCSGRREINAEILELKRNLQRFFRGETPARKVLCQRSFASDGGVQKKERRGVILQESYKLNYICGCLGKRRFGSALQMDQS